MELSEREQIQEEGRVKRNSRERKAINEAIRRERDV